MNMVDALKILDKERDAKKLEFELFPGNVYLKQYLEAYDLLASFVLSSFYCVSRIHNEYFEGCYDIENLR